MLDHQELCWEALLRGWSLDWAGPVRQLSAAGQLGCWSQYEESAPEHTQKLQECCYTLALSW